MLIIQLLAGVVINNFQANRKLNTMLLILKLIAALFIISYGILIIISAITEKKQYYLWVSTIEETIKNSALQIAIGLISAITGIVALVLYLK